MRARMAVEEIDWRAREDTRTLAEAIEIRGDKERYAMAVKAANLMVAQKDDEAGAMRKVAGKSVKNDSMKGLNETLKKTVSSL